MSSPQRLRADPATDLIEVADAIGRRLSREAIWHGERCNWVGGRLGPGPGGELVEHHAALDATLYEGTAGVALFLTELHATTGDPDARHTALGALRQAVEAMGASAPGRGLYSGTSGVALVAARAGLLLEEPWLLDAARELADGVTAPTSAGEELDLLNGTAGTVLALLALTRLLDEGDGGRWVDSAVALGDDLIASAEGSANGDGISWRSPAMPTRRNLTGLSHGVAGIALALVELGAATGEQRFSKAAKRAFDYERSTFDRTARNWPDLRELFPGRQSNEPGFATFWCHGGPGIALSRLTALERLGGSRWRSEAEAGLELARQTVSRSLGHGGGNFSLCHGVAGNAEILADGARVLGGRWRKSAGAAAEVAAAGVDRYGAEGPWPCGAGSLEAPGLMLGIAGIGYFYLRAGGARVPSVLRPDPSSVGNASPDRGDSGGN